VDHDFGGYVLKFPKPNTGIVFFIQFIISFASFLGVLLNLSPADIPRTALRKRLGERGIGFGVHPRRALEKKAKRRKNVDINAEPTSVPKIKHAHKS